MKDFFVRDIQTNSIENELKEIGFDESYYKIASDKYKYKNLKIYGLTSTQANILKQTALSLGADCATHKDVITGKIEQSDVILGGSYSQLKKIAEKLNSQPFKLNLLGEKIIESLNRKETETKLAGILNVTPDSFSDGGLYYNPKDAQKHLLQMIEEGADMIDIGAESTKPGSEPVDDNVQIERLKPILEFIQKENINIPISIDTRSSKVAEFVLNSGASIINDVSGFDYDSKMPYIIKKYGAKVIIQHSKGTPKTMQNSPYYENVTEEVYKSLKAKVNFAHEIGISDIIIDPGIGFGKTQSDNYKILNNIEEFYSLECPVMVGISRKSLLNCPNENVETKDALTLAVSYPLIIKGVDYLRVHNVGLHKKLLNLIHDNS